MEFSASHLHKRLLDDISGRKLAGLEHFILLLYSPTILKNIPCLFLQDLQPNDLANQLYYIQMLLNVEKSRE